MAGVPIALVLATVLVRREIPTHSAIRAFLDRQSECGGLLMAAEDVRLGNWQDQIPSLSIPHLRWHSGRSWGLFIISALFVLVSLFAPERFIKIKESYPLEVSDETRKLVTQIDTLKEEEILNTTKAKSLQEKLNQLNTEASGEDPAKTWEALDHLQDTLSKTAKEAAEKDLENMERLAKAQALTEGLKDRVSTMNPKVMKEAMEELSRMMQEMAKTNEALDKNLSQQTLDALRAGSLSSEQLKEILETLQQNKEDITNRLGKLRKADLIDLKTLKLGEKLGQSDNSELIAFSEGNGETTPDSDLIVLSLPGKGGIERGRGDAPMTWGENTSEGGIRFKEQALPPAAVADLKESQLVGTSVGAPTTEAAHESSTSGALNNAKAGGGSVVTQTLLPRHRGTVKRYFERP